MEFIDFIDFMGFMTSNGLSFASYWYNSKLFILCLCTLIVGHTF